ncbi:MAG: tetratricopeptide repeat protein [Planctomycetota bacterium]|jgi:tetratricopeptide (TPR) repeat protein
MATPNGLLQEAGKLIEKGKLKEAKARLEEAVAIDAEFAPAYLALGGIHISEANKIASRLLRQGKTPEQARVYKEWARMRAAYEHAISYYKNAIKFGDAEGYLGLGACLFNMGRPEESIRVYSEAEEVFRKSDDKKMLARVLFNRAGDLLCLGRAADAIPVIEEARELDSSLEGTGRLAVSVYQEAGEKTRALEILDSLISRDQKNEEYVKWRKQIEGE